MYVLTPAKLAIRDPPDAEPKEIEVPAGAAPIFPAGPHQVRNIGDDEVQILFVEALPACKPCGDGGFGDFKACCSANPENYKLLAEDDDWMTIELTMPVGHTDEIHNHRDHLIYVVEGDEVTIYPDGGAEGHAVPIAPGAGIPAPMTAGPMFTNHKVKNSGTKELKMIMFEMKN